MNPFVLENDLIEDVVRTYSNALGQHLPLYKGHCYRLLNYIIYMQRHQDNLDFLGVAIAFHDLGIWTHGTMDYLNPSFELAKTYVQNANVDISIADLKVAIKNHHKISSLQKVAPAEYLRKADLNDLSMGLLNEGVPRPFIKDMKACWPYLGFQKLIFGKVLLYALQNPFNPFPMLKW